MQQLRSVVVIGVLLCTASSTAFAQLARREEGRSISAASGQLRTPTERLAVSRAMLDSARRSLADGEAVLRAGDVQRANARFATARALRAAIIPDVSLASELAQVDAALRDDAEAIALGNTMLANAEIPPVPALASTVTEPAADVVSTAYVPAAAPTIRKRSADQLRARMAALDSAAERTRRGLAASIDATAPTAGLEEIGGRVLTLRTFESSNPPAPLGARKYQSSFETAATHFIYTEVSIGFVSEATAPAVELSCWTKLGDSVLVQEPVRVSHASDASLFLFTVRIGWGDPSRIEPGTYVTGCDRGDVPVLADSFTVTGTTARSAYATAKEAARMNAWVSAAAAYDTAAHLDSTVALYHYAHGVALERLYESAAAAAEYATASRLAPDELQYRLQYARELQHLRRLDEAAAEYRAVIQLDPSDAQHRMALGDVLLASGDRAGALAQYRMAASMDSANAYYRQRVAELERRE